RGGPRGGSVATRGGAAMNLSVEEIREVQEILVREGFQVEVDGRLGAKTKQALMQFQRRNGLLATGQIDARTMSSLGVSFGERGGTTGQGPRGSGGPANPNAPADTQSQGNQPGTTGQGRGNMPSNNQNPQGNQPSGTTGQGRGNMPSNNQNKPDTQNQPGNQNQPNNAPNAPQGRGNQPDR